MAYSWQYGIGTLLTGFFFFGLADSAFAGLAPNANQIDTVGERMVNSVADLPGLISALSYLLALLFAVTGILKLKEHVNNPTQTPLRISVIRFLVGGGLLALPMVYRAMATTFNGGQNTVFDPSGPMGGILSSLLGKVGTLIPLNNINNLLATIQGSIEDLPGVVAVVAYLLGLLFGVAGLLKLKEHVENPEQTALREPVIRLLAGGALFAIPTVYNAMFGLVGDGGTWGSITSFFGAAGMLFSSYTTTVCNPIASTVGNIPGLGGGNTLGDSLCGIFFNSGSATAFLTCIGYLIGLVLGVWGVLKIKAHVLNPQQTSLWEGISRLVAGGFFFALPVIVEVLRTTMAPPIATGIAAVAQTTGFNEGTPSCDNTGGLDTALYCLMADVTGPMHVVINFFCTVAGFVLAMIGISRLMKGAQDGARGPGGLGTLMTFAAAGALLSYNALVRVVSTSLSMTIPGVGLTRTNAEMQYVEGMTNAEQMHVHTVISAVIKFMIIVGLISFVRGIFIIRSVAEGNSQASLMAGVTHMVGGALAVNLGPLINLVQSTLGISAYGIAFS